MAGGHAFARCFIVLLLVLGAAGALAGAAVATAPTLSPVRVMSVTEPGQTWVEIQYTADFGESPWPTPDGWFEKVTVVLSDVVSGVELAREELFTSGRDGAVLSPAVSCYNRWLTATVTAANPHGSATQTGDNMPLGPPVIRWVWMDAPYGQGAVGDEVYLIGEDLGDIQATSTLYFEPGHLVAPIFRWGDHEVGFVVPQGAKTGTVHVETIKGRSQDWEFRVLGPTMSGHVFDGHGTSPRQHAVQDARVDLREAGVDEVLDTDYTDQNGKFAFSCQLDREKEYRVTVTLESADGLLVMKKGSETVSFAMDFAEDSEGLGLTDVEFNCRMGSWIEDSTIPDDDVDSAAAIWHWLQLNRQAAREVGYDLQTVLPVYVFDSTSAGYSAFYSQSENAIYLGSHFCDDDTHAGAAPATPADAYPPPWQFRKNRETHEFGHALMNEVMNGGWTKWAGVKNHGGYFNPHTGDSLSEGFAEWWSMVADDLSSMSDEPDQYDGWGYLAGSDARKAWTPVDPAAPTAAPKGYTEEEFAAAGLLRSLQTVLGGDLSGFGKIVGCLPLDGDVTDFRNELIAAGCLPEMVDGVFFKYGFFADTDGDWKHDPGEPVGAGNGVPCKVLYDDAVGAVDVAARPDRHDFPFNPDSFVKVTMKGAPPAAESVVKVAVRHAADPSPDYTVDSPVIGTSGLVFVYLDPGATSVAIEATGADDVASPDRVALTVDEWEAKQASAVNDIALTRTFRVDRITVGTPAAPKTIRRGKATTVTGSLLPQHEAGTSPVRVVKYLQVGRKWKSKGFVAAKVADAASGSRYSCKVKLTTAGKWRLRAFAPADEAHKATWSKGYDYVTVR